MIGDVIHPAVTSGANAMTAYDDRVLLLADSRIAQPGTRRRRRRRRRPVVVVVVVVVVVSGSHGGKRKKGRLISASEKLLAARVDR